MYQEQVRDAYEHCRRVTQRASKTFYWGSVFLPQPKRSAIWAVYALCRLVDDIVDEAVASQVVTAAHGHLSGAASPQRALDYWRKELEQIYTRGGAAEGLVQMAWGDMLEHYAVPLRPVLDLLEGVEMDLTVKRYQTFEELYLYCYRVAGTVGLLTSPIFGYQHEKALPRAVELGVALQLTNILRDIGEDARRDRIYIPLDEMARFGYSEGNLRAGTINEAFCDLLRFQIARAEQYYRCAQPGIALLSSDCRLAIRLSSSLYHSILERIATNNYDVFTKRASVPFQTKLAAVSQFWFSQHFGSVA
jgi:phytoene synthase